VSNYLTPLQEVGDILRIERLKARLRQRDLADRTGMHTSTVCRIEQGQLSELPVATLMRLSEELGISPTVITAPFFTDRKARRRHSEQVAS
jgi:transcriptional regulator with XRE-family HTH domain